MSLLGKGRGIINLYYLSTDKSQVKLQSSNQAFLCRKLAFVLFLEENMCCGYLLEAPRRDASNEYPQHIFFGEELQLSTHKI